MKSELVCELGMIPSGAPVGHHAPPRSPHDTGSHSQDEITHFMSHSNNYLPGFSTIRPDSGSWAERRGALKPRDSEPLRRGLGFPRIQGREQGRGARLGARPLGPASAGAEGPEARACTRDAWPISLRMSPRAADGDSSSLWKRLGRPLLAPGTGR